MYDDKSPESHLIVNGHLFLPNYGHLFSPLVATTLPTSRFAGFRCLGQRHHAFPRGCLGEPVAV
jgi:hypothetical protein